MKVFYGFYFLAELGHVLGFIAKLLVEDSAVIFHSDSFKLLDVFEAIFSYHVGPEAVVDFVGVEVFNQLFDMGPKIKE